MSEQWWFDPGTREVTRGKAEPWMKRMGPYPTREAAVEALAAAAERTEAWDAEQEAWDKAWDDEED